MAIDFSVIIPSRNRPGLVRKAIDSVLQQTHRSVDVIVVNDGSDGDCAVEYGRLATELKGRVTVINLVPTSRGHGPSYAINTGGFHAHGTHLCFLDDDDTWTDVEHLARAADIIGRVDGPVDAYLTNQHAYVNDTLRTEHIWIEGLLERVRRPMAPNALGAYEVTVADLMQCPGFSHLNTTIVRRELFLRISGMDNRIRYEGDRDFYLRVIDAAETILYVPRVVSRHNIPDAIARNSESTAATALEKHLDQIRVFDKAILWAKHPAIRAHGQRHKRFALKKISFLLSENNQYRSSLYYAKEALIIGFTFKWVLYTILLYFRNITNR